MNWIFVKSIRYLFFSFEYLKYASDHDDYHKVLAKRSNIGKPGLWMYGLGRRNANSFIVTSPDTRSNILNAEILGKISEHYIFQLLAKEHILVQNRSDWSKI